jgi:hypothetical protein
MAFDQASASPWGEIANATLTFLRPTTWDIDPVTGNEIPVAWSKLQGRAYFSKASLATGAGTPIPGSDVGRGVPIGSYAVSGYTVGILPAWANEPINQKVECTVDYLGDGYFYYQGAIAVVRAEVESAGVGTPIQGYFTRQGS